MQDLSHALRRPWHPLATIQALATAAKYGRTSSKLKPLGSLKVNELREELQARSCKISSKDVKPELQEKRTLTLEGVQRIPSLLTLNPIQSLSDVHLEDYEVLDCEPLHDIKGYLHKILPEVPHLLPASLSQECTQILDSTLPKQKVSGGLLHIAAIKLLLKLLNSRADRLVTMLVETIVRFSEILYLTDSKQCPKMVIRLNNCTCLHHELCNELLSSPKCQTVTRLFGVYLHGSCTNIYDTRLLVKRDHFVGVIKTALLV